MIRPAIHADIPRMLELGRAMHAESPQFRAYAWDDYKTGHLIAYLIDNDDGFAVVCEQGETIVGGFLGIITEQFFSFDRFAQDFALFVDPGRRGAQAGKQLVEAFKAWARGQGVPATIGVSTGVHVENTGRLLEVCGFERYGYLYAEKGV